jgi:hypothetical protein
LLHYPVSREIVLQAIVTLVGVVRPSPTRTFATL